MIIVFFIGRVLFGGYFIYSGYNHFKKLDQMTAYAKMKGVPSPKLATQITGIMLLLGGIGLVIGLKMKIASIILAIFMAGVSFKMHSFWKIQDPALKNTEQMAFFKNMAILGSLLMFVHLLW